MDYITRNIYIGDWGDGHYGSFQGAKLCVYDEPPVFDDIIWLPILGGESYSGVPRAVGNRLDAAGAIISYYAHRLNMPILVFCRAGVERSPLTVAWFLVSKGLMPNFDSAYRLIQRCRPAVQKRVAWLHGAVPA